jgi:pimeloyl-ACP methyl ester carboxylesterase
MMPEGGQNEKTFMARNILENIYNGKAGFLSTSSEPESSPSVPWDLSSFDEDNLAKAVRGSRLSTLPTVTSDKLRFSGSDFLLSFEGIRLFTSIAVCSVSQRLYDQISAEDIESARQLISRIGMEVSWPLELRAFLIHNLMTYVVAYRNTFYFSSGNEGQDAEFILPVWTGMQYELKPCLFEEEVNICGGVSARIFVPVDKKGAPTYLFHGTLIWNLASGAGVTICDDFNPLGIGEEIRQHAHQRLEARMKNDINRFGHAPVAIGQSLGGLIATGLAVDLPHLVSKVIAFAPPRPSYSLFHKWKNLKQCPSIDTFIGQFGGGSDPITLLGDMWIGNVYQVSNSHRCGMLQRHIAPIGQCLNFDIQKLDTNIINYAWWRRPWWLIQRVLATAVYCVLEPILLLKRFMFGWNTGGRWRYGFLGSFKTWIS